MNKNIINKTFIILLYLLTIYKVYLNEYKKLNQSVFKAVYLNEYKKLNQSVFKAFKTIDSIILIRTSSEPIGSEYRISPLNLISVLLSLCS